MQALPGKLSPFFVPRNNFHNMVHLQKGKSYGFLMPNPQTVGSTPVHVIFQVSTELIVVTIIITEMFRV